LSLPIHQLLLPLLLLLCGSQVAGRRYSGFRDGVYPEVSINTASHQSGLIRVYIQGPNLVEPRTVWQQCCRVTSHTLMLPSLLLLINTPQSLNTGALPKEKDKPASTKR